MRTTLTRLALGAALAAITLPAAASDRVEKKLKLDPGGSLSVDIEAGSVSVTGASESGAVVVVTSKSPDLEERWALSFEESPGELRIGAKRKGSRGDDSSSGGWLSRWFGDSSTSAPKFDIRVPHRTKVTVETAGGGIRLVATEGAAKLETAGGSISVSDSKGTATVSTAGGSIEFSNFDGDLQAETAGGSVRVSAVTGDARVDTAGGSILLDGVGGRVDAETAGGSIDASLAAGNDRGGRLATMGGSIRLRLDPSAKLAIDASTSGGSVSADLASLRITRKTRSSLEGTLGTGGEKLVLETAAGSIRIEARDPR